MSAANPLWGAPRVHAALMMLRIKVAQSTVAKYMARGRRPPSLSWMTFLHNHAARIATMDLLVVPTIGVPASLCLCDPPTRSPADRIDCNHIPSDRRNGLPGTSPPPFPGRRLPHYVLHDRDGVYGDVVRPRLAAMGIRD
jgi:hypothetical protein